MNETFAVNDDRMSTSAFLLPDGTNTTNTTTKMVIVEGGREYFLMNTDQRNLLSGTAKRID